MNTSFLFSDIILPQRYDMLLLMSARILVVDDEPSVTNLIAYNLRKAHYEVLTAANGREIGRASCRERV